MLDAPAVPDEQLGGPRCRAQKAIDNSRLADPGLSRDEHEPPLPGTRLVEQPLEMSELALATGGPFHTRAANRLGGAIRGRGGLGDGSSSRSVERRVLPEHAPLEILQPGGRVDPELLVEHAPERLIDVERFCVPTRPVEGEHLLRAQPLAQRMAGDQGLELPDDVRVIAEREIGLDPPLQRRRPLLLEARPLVAREGLRELRQGRATPEPESPSKQLGRGAGVSVGERLAPRRDEPLKPPEIELLVGDFEHVAGRPRLQPGLGQRLPQLRDVDLHHLLR